MGRAPCCDKATVKKGPWSPEEDAMLKNYIEEHGTGGNWIALPHKIGLKRCGKSCRLRWLNYLRPNIKHGDFTPEEDSIICSLYISIGSRWSIIAAQLPGRTDNDVKNYWNTKLKKTLLGRRNKGRDTQQHPSRSSTGAAANETAAETTNVVSDGERALSASAMERIQLCMQLQELQNPLSAAIPNPALMWPACRAAQSNNNSNNSNVTVAEQGGQSMSSLNEHHLNAQLESAAMDGLTSPSSAENSNDVINIEAELQELLYGEANQQVRPGVIDNGGMPQQGGMDWWSYEQTKPVNCWDFTPEPNSVFQDYTSVYDI